MANEGSGQTPSDYPIAQDSFLLEPWISNVLEPLDDPGLNNSPRIRELSQIFRDNLSAVISTCSIPYQLVADKIFRLRFQQFYLAERVRRTPLVRLPIPGLYDEPDLHEASESAPSGNDDFPPELDKEAREAAEARFGEEIKSQDRVIILRDQIIDALNDSLKSAPFASAASELLRQGAVLTWGALEVLAQDLFTHIVNSRTDLALKLLRDDNSKKVFQIKSIPIETLERYQFNVTAGLGSILCESRSIDSVPMMKTVFSVLFSEPTETNRVLGNRFLWILNQQRHLIVHRRGVIDASYVENTGEPFLIGSQLAISPSDLENYLCIVAQVGAFMIREGERCLVSPS